MANARNQQAPAASTSTAPADSGKWTPPENAESVELAEFVQWPRVGQVLIGRIKQFRQRPPQSADDKPWNTFILEPALLMEDGTRASATRYHSLALSLTTHLLLLFPSPEQEVGKNIALQFTGTRPSDVKGRSPIREFKVYRLTDDQARSAFADAKQGGHYDAASRGAGNSAEQDDLPF